jgi:hypothetical protein
MLCCRGSSAANSRQSSSGRRGCGAAARVSVLQRRCALRCGRASGASGAARRCVRRLLGAARSTGGAVAPAHGARAARQKQNVYR